MHSPRSLIALLSALLGIAAIAQADENDADKPRVEISKETTYLTEPLTEDGRIDYAEAVDRAYAKDVTPENNGAVLFLRAVGPSEISEQTRAEYLKRLGLSGLPETGDYLVSLAAANGVTDQAEIQKLYEEMDVALKGPWSAAEHPRLVRWLEANERPLNLIVAGTKKEKFYLPMIASKGSSPALIAVLLPMLQETRRAARILGTRAGYRLGRGDLAGAQEDLMATHRLGRLITGHPTIIGRMVGLAIDAVATHGDMALANHKSLTADAALKYRARLQKLPPISPMVDAIDQCERLMFLETVCVLAYGENVTEEFGVVGPSARPTAQAVRKAAQLMLGSGLDWNAILRKGNAFYDRVVDAAKNPTYLERVAALKAIEKELGGERATRQRSAFSKVLSAALAPRKTATDEIGDVLLSLLAPSLSQAITAEERAVMRQNLLDAAFALAAYRADEGAYPQALAELSPKYLKEIPTDAFSGSPVKYRRTNSGYTLYSVGRNQKDDGGKDMHEGQGADDDVLRGTR